MEFNSIFQKEINDYIKLQEKTNKDPELPSLILHSLDKHIRYRLSDKKLNDSIMNEWVKKLHVNKSQNAIVLYLSIYNQFAKYLNELGYYAVKLDPPKQTKNIRYRVFSKEEMDLIFAVIDAAYRDNNHLSYLCPLFFRLLYGLGITADEAIVIRKDDVDLTNKTITVYKRSNHQPRTLPLTDELASILRKYVKGINLNNYVFSKKRTSEVIGIEYFYVRWKEILKATSLYNDEDGVRYSLKSLRFSFIAENISQATGRGELLDEFLDYLSAFLGFNKFDKAEFLLSNCGNIRNRKIMEILTDEDEEIFEGL